MSVRREVKLVVPGAASIEDQRGGQTWGKAEVQFIEMSEAPQVVDAGDGPWVEIRWNQWRLAVPAADLAEVAREFAVGRPVEFGAGRPVTVGSNTGHGHVWPRPDGHKARCGGPALCAECARDYARVHDRPWSRDALARPERVGGRLRPDRAG
jgi:hypothetical protein